MATEQPVSVVSYLPANPDSPDWWMKRLSEALSARREEADFFEDYYEGEHPLPWLAPQARDEFRRILRMTRANYMGLVVDSVVERINIEGFRFGLEGDKSPQLQEAALRAWGHWQRNNMDAEADMGIQESAIAGEAFFIVTPDKSNPREPIMGMESASNAIVGYEPGTRRRVRRCGLREWRDEWTGQRMATLYLRIMGDRGWDLRVFKYVSESSVGSQWRRREVPGEDWGASGEMEDVPLIPLPYKPRLRTGGRSVLWDLTDSQDRINKTLADRLITQDYGAFPQKWIAGWPDTDEDGNPNTIDIGRNRAVTTDVSAKETRFGQWESAPLDPYSMAVREDIKVIASRSRVPAQYLLGELNNVNGQTLQAAEVGLVSVVKQQSKYVSEAAEEAMRLMLKLAGDSAASDMTMETILSDPQYRVEGERVDAAVKKRQSGIASLRQARVDVGYSETTIRQLEEDDSREAVPPAVAQALRQVRQPTDGATGPAVNG